MAEPVRRRRRVRTGDPAEPPAGGRAPADPPDGGRAPAGGRPAARGSASAEVGNPAPAPAQGAPGGPGPKPGTAGAPGPKPGTAGGPGPKPEEAGGLWTEPSTTPDLELSQAERGLRGLVGGGSSQVTPAAAMRARDAARPRSEDLERAQAELTIVRRNWSPDSTFPPRRP